MTSRCRITLLLIGALLCAPSWARGQQVVAVLSSELKPYVEAYEAFREELGHAVPVVSLSAGEPKISDTTRVVVAFGSRAAKQRYAEQSVLIYCMAPGTAPETVRNRGRAIRISMLPHVDVLIAGLRQVQPDLRRLAVFWQMAGYGGYVDELRGAAGQHGIDIVGRHLQDATMLPASLRALIDAGANGIWLPPDPLLIDAQTFAVLRDFSQANSMPLYAPTAGFVTEGAVASVAVSYAQVGREAAVLTGRVLSGEALPAEVFPQTSELTLNLQAAAASGITVPEEVVRNARLVSP